MAQASVTLKCDRDGVEATAYGAAVPEGWSTVNIMAARPAMLHLCPACTAGLQAFVDASGSTFDFTTPLATG